MSIATDGAGDQHSGYATIETTSGSNPSGIAILGLRKNGVLVSEAGVSDSPLLAGGRIYAEVGAPGTTDTGMAIANPNNVTVRVTYIVTDVRGAVVKTDFRDLAPGEHVAGFLHEPPYAVGYGFRGTFSFTASAPVGVIALRSFINERGDFLITTLPVIDLLEPAHIGTQVIPHFAVGDGWGTQIFLVNPTDFEQTGTVQFLNAGSGTTASTPVTVLIDGLARTDTTYTIAPKSSGKVIVNSTGTSASGSVYIIPASGGPAPTPLVVFSFKPGAITFSEAGVPVQTGTSFQMYVESSHRPTILSGFAIANTDNKLGSVTLELYTLDGTLFATRAGLPPPPSGQVVGFVNEFFPDLPEPFQGLLRMRTTSSGISVVALRQRYNERGDYLITTMPPTNEATPATASVRIFPHFVNGGGYSTQFILFSVIPGQSSTGIVRFRGENGMAYGIRLR